MSGVGNSRGGRRPATVLLVDDHPVVLRGLCNLFGTYPEFKVIDQITDSTRVRQAVRELAPDVVVLDLMMPGLSGIDLITRLTREPGAPHVVVLSMHSNVAYVWAALRAGAAAYVLKCAAGEELIKAVGHALRGQRYLSADISEPEVDGYESRTRASPVDPYEMLTRRERQVFLLVAEGQTSGQIAAILNLGVRTVETHRSNLMRKLELRSHIELVRYAIARGIILP